MERLGRWFTRREPVPLRRRCSRVHRPALAVGFVREIRAHQAAGPRQRRRALHFWAAIPEKNPLNSERAVDTLASAYLDRPFALQHYLTLDRAAACSNGGQVAGSDLHFSLSAEPQRCGGRLPGRRFRQLALSRHLVG